MDFLDSLKEIKGQMVKEQKAQAPKPKPKPRQREYKQLFTHRLMLPAAFQWPCSRQERA